MLTISFAGTGGVKFFSTLSCALLIFYKEAIGCVFYEDRAVLVNRLLRLHQLQQQGRTQSEHPSDPMH
jgi:hypothetical protein